MLGSIDQKTNGADHVLIEFPTKLNVLVIEDDFGDFDATARALRKIDSFEIKITRARTLEAARRAAAEVEFDVYLVDFNLGNETGARFLQEMGGRSCKAVSILLTGLKEKSVHEISLRAGAIGCIDKRDLSPTLLEATIRSAHYTHQLEAEVASWLRSLSAHSTNVLQDELRSLLQKMPWLAERKC